MAILRFLPSIFDVLNMVIGNREKSERTSTKTTRQLTEQYFPFSSLFTICVSI